MAWEPEDSDFYFVVFFFACCNVPHQSFQPLTLFPSPIRGVGWAWHRGTQRRSESGQGPSGSLPRLGAQRDWCLAGSLSPSSPRSSLPCFPSLPTSLLSCRHLGAPPVVPGPPKATAGPPGVPCSVPETPLPQSNSGGTGSAPVRRCGDPRLRPFFQAQWPRGRSGNGREKSGGRRRARRAGQTRPRQGPVLRGVCGEESAGHVAQRHSCPRSSAPLMGLPRVKTSSLCSSRTGLRSARPPPLPPWDRPPRRPLCPVATLSPCLPPRGG